MLEVCLSDGYSGHFMPGEELFYAQICGTSVVAFPHYPVALMAITWYGCGPELSPLDYFQEFETVAIQDSAAPYFTR